MNVKITPELDRDEVQFESVEPFLQNDIQLVAQLYVSYEIAVSSGRALPSDLNIKFRSYNARLKALNDALLESEYGAPVVFTGFSLDSNSDYVVTYAFMIGRMAA
jgi:hypothetical protein